MVMKKTVVLLVLTTISFSTFAQTNIQENLLRVQTHKVEEKSNEKSYFDLKDLTSNYVSWGINPENPSSINLLEGGKNFKKKKDIIVALVDTGIEPFHPFL